MHLSESGLIWSAGFCWINLSPFSHTVYWFLSAHLGAGNFRLNSLMSVEHIEIGDPYVAFLSGVGVAPARGVQFLQEGVSVRLSRFPVAMWYCG